MLLMNTHKPVKLLENSVVEEVTGEMEYETTKSNSSITRKIILTSGNGGG